MKIFPLTAFKDNYIWVLEDTSSFWVVDPGDATPVISFSEKNNIPLAGILLTHHHKDHSGGIAELVKENKNIPVYASAKSPISSVTHHLKEADKITCGSLILSVLEIPGHTLDHIAFYNDDVLFCGDTLFSAGCGRVFEGTYEQMFHSLERLKKLSSSTLVYCGHEYTLQNLHFAKEVEPNNVFISEKIKQVIALREKNSPTLPSVLSDELKMNPFLRCGEKEVAELATHYNQAALTETVAVFQCLREWKNAL